VSSRACRARGLKTARHRRVRLPEPRRRDVPSHGCGERDLKGFTEEFTGRLPRPSPAGAGDARVLERETQVWFEITPCSSRATTTRTRRSPRSRSGSWRELGPDVPLHFRRSIPISRYSARRRRPRRRSPAPAASRYAPTALRHTGNVHDEDGQSTAALLREIPHRPDWYTLTRWTLDLRVAACPAARSCLVSSPASPARGARAPPRAPATDLTECSEEITAETRERGGSGFGPVPCAVPDDSQIRFSATSEPPR